MTTDNLAIAVSKLTEQGLDSQTIADALDLPLSQVAVTIEQVRTGALTLTRTTRSPAEKEIAQEARGLALDVIKRAKSVLQFGPPAHRMAIMRAVLPNAMKTLGVEQVSEQQQVRVELDSLFAQMRNVPVKETVVTPTEIIDVEPEATLVAVEDQDQEPPATAFGP